MPEPTKRAIELLQDLDLDISKQIDSKNLDFLVEKLQKSSVSENRVSQIQTTKKFNKNSRYEDLLNRKKKLDLPPIAETPEFEVVKVSEISQHSGLNKMFDLNQIFTVPSQILGPYATLDGRRVFYKFYNYIDDFKVFFAGETQAAFIIPIKLKGISVINRRISTLSLSKGSVWIRADLLDPSAAKENYIGLKIISGNLALGGTYTLSQNSIQIPKTSILEVDFVLDNSYQFENTLEIGMDGKSSVFKPTGILKLKTGRNRLIVVEIGEFYGKTLEWEGNFWKKDLLFHWDAEKKYMGLNLSLADTRFIVKNSKSQLYTLKGQARITQSEWLLPSRILNQNQSIEVKFNGFMGLNVEKGLMTNWDGIKSLETILEANECKIKFFNGYFNLYSEKADFGYIHDRLTLWQKSKENLSKMEMDVNFKDYGMLQILSQSDLADSVSSYADTEFFIDKPLLADNTPVHPKTKKSFYGKIVTIDAKNMIVLDSNLLTEDEDSNFEYSYYAPKDEVKYQFVLENAYFTTTKETTLLLHSKYDDHNHLYEGNLMLNYGIFDLLPTLPHPYTSNWNGERKERNFVNGNLQAITNWQTEDKFTEAEVTFKMNHQFTGTNKLDFDHLEELNVRLDKSDKEQNIEKINITNNFMLFDVSTQSDHWGIALSFDNREVMRKIYHDDVNITGENLVTINRNYLQAPMGLLQGLTLPQVSWEPVVNITPPQTPADPQAGVLDQISNTIPTVFSQIDNQLVKIHPKNYLKTFQQNLRNNTGETQRSLNSKILFTLPNGKYATASLNPYSNEAMYCNEDHLQFIMPKFEIQSLKLQGGLQFRIAAFKDASPDVPPKLRGKTKQIATLVDFPGISILGDTVTKIFNSVFNKNNYSDTGVPITHIDFSGYGANTFSNWKNPLMKFASISQAKFDILKGRTAHELVQAVSVIYPWGISVTRTVTFLRNNNALIFREDSGWLAQSEGLFDFSFCFGDLSNEFPNPYDIYPGLIEGLFDVKNIREDYNEIIQFWYNLKTDDYYLNNDEVIIVSNESESIEVEFIAVYFDANVKIDALDERSTGKQFKGYLQIKPEAIPIPARVLKEILEKSQTPISGNIDALIPVERTLQKFKANAVEIKTSYNEDEDAIIFVGEVKGSVILPGDGSWSVVEVDQNSGVVKNLETGTSVGLIKDGLRPKGNGLPYTSNATNTRLAFPDSLKNNYYPKKYGFLQNTDTQKLLLKSIEYVKGEPEQYTSDPALLADCFRLMNSKGPFPNLTDAITIDDAEKTVMNLLPTGVQKIFKMEVPDDFNFNIIGEEGSAFRIYMKYTAIDKDANSTDKSIIDYVTDSESAEKWANKMHNITVAVDLAVFKPIMYISGNFGNGKKGSPSLECGMGPQLKLDPALQKIYDILEFLNNLDPTQPSEAIKKGLKIAMSNSADSWEYKFKADKEIPFVKFPFDPISYNAPTTPLKMDAFFKLGVYFNQPIKIPKTIDQIKPSVGAYLELGADIRVMCVSLAAATIYAIGRAEVGLAADFNTPPTLYFKFGFGVELAVGLPVIGSVAVTYMVGVDMKINSKELIVGAFIYFRGRVEIFGGIVTISISIEAAGQIQAKLGPGQPTNCIAMCTFALDISIAFVININFTETWQETRQIS